MSSAYLRLLIFLLAILIPVCASSSLAFLMMYSAYKLNEQGDSIQPWHNPFPILNQSVVPCPVLTVTSWPSYKFLKRQIRCFGIPSLEEFSTVCCDPHSQRLYHSQWSRSRCFSGILFIQNIKEYICYLGLGLGKFMFRYDSDSMMHKTSKWLMRHQNLKLPFLFLQLLL